MSKFDLFYPVRPYSLNQAFGGNPDLYKQFGIKGHNGLDLLATHGQPVYAAHDGTCFPEIDANQGHGVVIRSDEAYEYNGEAVHFKSIYWHLVQADAVVKTGQKVKAGDLIGYADNTGFSLGDHLHFGLKPQAWNEESWTWWNTEQKNGYLGAIDPEPFFNGYYAQDAGLVLTLMRSLVQLLTQWVEELKKDKYKII